MKLGVVADVHWPADPSTRAAWHNPFDFAGLPDRLDRARERFESEAVDAILVCGDLTHDGDRESVRAACRRLVGSAPVLVVAGNHDCLARDDQPGRSLPHGATVLSGDWIEIGGQRLAGVSIARNDGTGAFRWTGAPVDNASPAVVVAHFPVLSRAGRVAERGLAYPGDLTNRGALEQRLRSGSPIVVLSGHLHVREACAHGTLLQLSAGALVEAPHEVAIVDVHAARAELRVRRRVHCLGPGPAGSDPVLAPADETWAFAHRAWRAERPAPERAA